MKTISRLLGILILIFTTTSYRISPAFGQKSLVPGVATITVSTTADEFPVEPDGKCSLREAIYSANFGDMGGCVRSGSGDVTVYIPEGTYTLTLHGRGEEGGGTGDLDIYSSMSILGDGIGVTIIDGDDADRVFDIFAGYLATVSISELSIYHGNPDIGNGGAIQDNTNLYLTNVRIDSNRTAGSGGGIYHKSGPLPTTSPRQSTDPDFPASPAIAYSILTLHGSTIANNKANGYGGGIINTEHAGMAISHSTIFFNQADYDLNGNGGCGGMYNLSEMDVTLDYVHMSNNTAGNANGGGFCSANNTPGDSVIIRDSRFAVNSASAGLGGNIIHGGSGLLEMVRSEVTLGSAQYGAGIYSTAYTDLTNVTISYNDASVSGGGIYVTDGDFILLHTTIADNEAESGAGIYSDIFDLGDPLLMKGSIIARNRTPGGILANCVGGGDAHIASSGYNLTDGSFCSAPMTGDLAHTDARLGAYGEHGSANTTYTYALQYGSPAIDAADPSMGPVEDQRGISRPQPVGGVRDIGAYESNVSWWFLPMISK